MLILLLVCICTLSAQANNSWVVKISQGSVIGYKNSDNDIFSFYGIPYAKAPTGKHRYKGPLPPESWKEPLKAVNNSIKCPQSGIFAAEDCLITNVFVPNRSVTKLPVLVVTHGGSYTSGYSGMLTYEHLIETSQMVVVTYNYRLGAHGFLCLGTEDVPGNAGIKDQVALFRWVKKNIVAFGGNPDDVTALGFSAGSSATDLLMISNTTNNLFHKVILDSGANVAYWSVQMDPIKHAQYYAKLLNFSEVHDLKKLEEFYKTISYDELVSQSAVDVFSPCIERDVGQEIFLSDSPVNILKSGNYRNVPILRGFSNMEGLLEIKLFDIYKTVMNQYFSTVLPPDLKFSNNKEKQSVADMVKKFYFGDKKINEMTIIDFVNYCSDIIFTYPILRSIKLNLEAGNKNIYLYEYTFVDKNSSYVPHTHVMGATHCSESYAVADGANGSDTDESSITEDYKQMKTIMRTLWSNFIATGKPVTNKGQLPIWPPVGENWSPHMELNLPITIQGSLLLKRAQFWEGIYEKYYRHPIGPT